MGHPVLALTAALALALALAGLVGALGSSSGQGCTR